MQDFKRKLKAVRKTALFFGILSLLLTSLSKLVLRISMENESFVKSRNKNITGIQKEPKNTIDALIVGDSLSYSAFSPMQLWEQQGITAYVCGQSGQKLQEAYYTLLTAIKSQTPKIVILETNMIFREQKVVSSLQTTIIEEGSYRIPLFRYHDIWKPLLIGATYGEEMYKGFSLREAVVPYTKGEYMKESTDKKEISEGVQYYMGKIIDLCKEKNIELLLAATPSPKNYNYRTYNALSNYAKEHGLKYLEMNLLQQEIGIDWNTDSLDKGDHLNLSGATKVTKYLGNYLQTNYKFSDHRKEAGYESWEKTGKEYSEKIKEKLR